MTQVMETAGVNTGIGICQIGSYKSYDFIKDFNLPNEKYRLVELFFRNNSFLENLRYKLFGADDRPCHELRKETHIETKIEYRFEWCYFIAIDIYCITNRLESIERNPYGQNDFIDSEIPLIAKTICPISQIVKSLMMGME